ncbi:MAG: HAMP domain-containing protein [Chloroflexi bacterium]|nr:HAMP domain-containing protein [Chloroflexota bacterium]
MKSANQIRSRLLLLLGRAFLGVLLFLILLFPIITAFVLTNYSERASLRFPLVSSLEGFYQGRGSWDGVESVFQRFDSFPPEYTLLLDADHRIILDGGQASASTVGSSYQFSSSDVKFQLQVDSQKVGTLVIKSLPFEWRGQLASGILFPVAGISFALGLFVVAIAFLLMRRFVNPLADVIYAARAVADGKLNTRIPAGGPQDLHSLAESFNEMASSLERNDRERRDMLADIAHELRTPLSVIRGRLEGIVDGIYPADGEQVSLALNQTYLLERLVDDLRLLTLAETRQLHFEKKTVDLARLISHSIEMFSAEAREKNISLSLEKASGDFALELDAQRTEQVIGNLIGNALRHPPEGSRVWLTLESYAETVRVSVNDNGTGVPDEDLPFLFDRFWRKEKSRARSSGGTGLGLAIAKQLVEAQGGTISAQNLPEGGLQVVVELKR